MPIELASVLPTACLLSSIVVVPSSKLRSGMDLSANQPTVMSLVVAESSSPLLPPSLAKSTDKLE